MRNMKRSILLVLALIGASVLFLGATPGTAGASSCQGSYASATASFAPPLSYYAEIGNCLDVSYIAVLYFPPGATHTTGWFDGSGYYANGKISGCYCDSAAIQYFGGTIGVHITAPCWFSGVHLETGYFWYKMKSITGGTWSNPVQVFGPNTTNVTC